MDTRVTIANRVKVTLLQTIMKEEILYAVFF